MIHLGHEPGAVRADRERALVLAVIDRRGDDRLLVFVAILEAGEEMRLIAADRAAEGEAGVLPIVRRAQAGQPSRASHDSGTDEQKSAAVQVVGAALGDHRHDAGHRLPVLGGKLVAQHAELGDRVERDVGFLHAVLIARVVEPIELVRRVAREDAADRLALRPGDRAGGDVRDARSHQREVEKVAADQRQFLNLLLRDAQGLHRLAGVEQRGLTDDGHGLGHGPDSQRDVDDRFRIGGKAQALATMRP